MDTPTDIECMLALTGRWRLVARTRRWARYRPIGRAGDDLFVPLRRPIDPDVLRHVTDALAASLPNQQATPAEQTPVPVTLATKIQFRSSDVLGDLLARSDPEEINATARRDLQRYYVLLRDTAFALPRTLARMLVRVARAQLLVGAEPDTLPQRLSMAAAALAGDHAADSMSASALDEWMRTWSPFERVAILDALEQAAIIHRRAPDLTDDDLVTALGLAAPESG